MFQILPIYAIEGSFKCADESGQNALPALNHPAGFWGLAPAGEANELVDELCWDVALELCIRTLDFSLVELLPMMVHGSHSDGWKLPLPDVRGEAFRDGRRLSSVWPARACQCGLRGLNNSGTTRSPSCLRSITKVPSNPL